MTGNQNLPGHHEPDLKKWAFEDNVKAKPAAISPLVALSDRLDGVHYALLGAACSHEPLTTPRSKAFNCIVIDRRPPSGFTQNLTACEPPGMPPLLG
jgi:hypothetical protein